MTVEPATESAAESTAESTAESAAESATEEQEDVKDPIILPVDELPEHCPAGQSKLDEIKNVLKDIEDMKGLRKFLMPKIDNAAKVLLMCMKKGEELQAETDKQFSVWS